MTRLIVAAFRLDKGVIQIEENCRQIHAAMSHTESRHLNDD